MKSLFDIWCELRNKEDRVLDSQLMVGGTRRTSVEILERFIALDSLKKEGQSPEMQAHLWGMLKVFSWLFSGENVDWLQFNLEYPKSFGYFSPVDIKVSNNFIIGEGVFTDVEPIVGGDDFLNVVGCPEDVED